MLSKQNIIILGAISIVTPIVGMLYDSFLFTFLLTEIPVFTASFLILSFYIKSNKTKLIVSGLIASIFPFILWIILPMFGMGLSH